MSAADQRRARTQYIGEDSCSKCHATESRDDLQVYINTWQGDATTLADNAKAAILAVTDAATPPAEYSLTDSTKPGYILIGRATWNYKAWEADSSDGAHNPAYIQAGLKKAEQLAMSAGGSFKNLFASNSVVPEGTGFVCGRVVNGDGTGAAGASLTCCPTGAATTADAAGNFAFMINPTGATTYSVTWIRLGDQDRPDQQSLSVKVAKRASRTTLKASVGEQNPGQQVGQAVGRRRACCAGRERQDPVPPHHERNLEVAGPPSSSRHEHLQQDQAG